VSINETSRHPDHVPPRTIVFVAYPQMGLLDLTGAQTVFWVANKAMTERGLPGYALHTASLTGGTITTGEGLAVHTRKLSEFDDDPIDTLIVPGSPSIRQILAENAALVDWLRQASVTATRTASVCSGTFLLAQAGLLDGRRAATHWVMAEWFERLYPEVELDQEAIFVQQQSVWTSAGISAGIDLALALVEADGGREVAMQVARHMVVYYRRPDNQEQWGALLQSQFPASV
jgi:transcriptional regulator GlxA family with amidase domain